MHVCTYVRTYVHIYIYIYTHIHMAAGEVAAVEGLHEQRYAGGLERMWSVIVIYLLLHVQGSPPGVSPPRISRFTTSSDTPAAWSACTP